MAINRGKDFENVFRQCCKNQSIYVHRLPDQTSHFMGSTNPCDFLVFKSPALFHIECKTTARNRLPLANISKNQITQLSTVVNYKNSYAGVLIWFYENDITLYVPIQTINALTLLKEKSISMETVKVLPHIVVSGEKKKVFYNYNINKLLLEIPQLELNN